MNVEIETKAAQFPEKEYINAIFVAVHSCHIMCLFIRVSLYMTSATINSYICDVGNSEEFCRKITEQK